MGRNEIGEELMECLVSGAVSRIKEMKRAGSDRSNSSGKHSIGFDQNNLTHLRLVLAFVKSRTVYPKSQ